MRLPRERFDFSPIATRPRWKLPRGARVAVWILMSVEEWDIERPMPRTLNTGPQGVAAIPDVPNWAWHEYGMRDRKSTRLNSSHVAISYAVFCLKKKKNTQHMNDP